MRHLALLALLGCAAPHAETIDASPTDGSIAPTCEDACDGGGGGSASYSTTFPLTENPISENGVWIRGAAEGIDWTNPKTTAGHVVASSVPTPTRYSDDIAILDPAKHPFSADQYAEATVYLANGYTGNGGGHEVELLLRFSIAAHDAHGYEVMWGLSGYLAIVHWNGVVQSYTPIYDPGTGSIAVPSDGDVLRAEIVGSTIRVYRNGSLIATVNDSTFSSGQPGIGFWPVDGAIPDNYGWASYTAGSL